MAATVFVMHVEDVQLQVVSVQLVVQIIITNDSTQLPTLSPEEYHS